MSASAPRSAGFEEVTGIDRSETYRLDDVEWLDRELGHAAPGRESNLMRLLLSRVTLNSMFQFSALLDAQGRMWDVNYAALRGGGLDRSDIHGRPFWEARWWQTSEATKARLREAIGRAAAGEFVRYDVDVIGRAQGRELITIDFNIAPVKDRDGAVRFLICEGRDVTEQRRLEAEVRRQREELARLDQLKTQFFANVSHEFRTPLTLMLGPAADALADAEELLGPLQRQRIALLQRNGLRLLKLVNALLDFSRIEAGRAQAAYEPTDLAALTADLASSFRAIMEKAGLRFTVDCPPLPEPVYVDRDMWEKIVLNLVSNAFKFTLEGEVVLQLRAAEGKARLTVRDTGIGIPTEALPHIFDRFHRVEGARGRSYEGSGIGLALAQELARLHGGLIAVESKPGEGSLFTVTVPVGAAHLSDERIGASPPPALPPTAASAYVEEALRWLPDEDEVPPSALDRRSDDGSAATVAPSPAEDGRRPRIVVADDNGDMRDYLKRLLSDAGYEVEAVVDGRAALAAVRREPPDLLLSDVMMPDLDGFALLREIRADPATVTVPFLLLSARAGEEARVEGLDAGADDYLVKPFTGRELTARVRANVALARMRRENERQRNEQRLRESEARLQAAVDLVGLGYYTWDSRTKALECDSRLKAMWGLPSDFAVDYEVLRGAIHPDDRARVDVAAVQCLDPRSDGVFDLEYRVIGITDGVERWIATRASIRFENDQPVASFGVALDVTQRKRAEQANLLLIGELLHRTRNLLGVVHSISAETLADARSLEDFRATFGDRLMALSRVQDLLSRGDASPVTIGELVNLELRALGANLNGDRVTVEGPDVALPPRTIQILALALHELGTNARKHGALAGPEGRLTVRWRLTQGPTGRRLALEWREQGGGAIGGDGASPRKGFGRKLIEDALPYQLDAETRLDFAPDGVVFSMSINLDGERTD